MKKSLGLNYSFKSNIIKSNNLENRIKTVYNKALNTNNTNNSNFTIKFLKSILDFCYINHGLTKKQMNQFEKIESFLSEDKKRDEWFLKYDDSKKRLFSICVEYYLIYYAAKPFAKESGFNSIIIAIKKDPSFIPTGKQYNRIINNKYSQKVIQSTLSKPKYPVGTLVKLNKMSNLYINYNKMAYVIQTNSSPVKSAVRGGKMYRIMVFGNSSTVEIEERFLSKAKVTL